MVLVGTGSHLCHDLRTLVYIVRLVQTIAQVLHATDAIENVVLRVDPASHIARVRCYSLCTRILSIGLLNYCPTRTWIITLVFF